MKIGNIEINKFASLAPMAGVTDRAFREICSLFGVAYFTSEMISAKGLIYNSQKTFRMLERSEMESPFAIQLFGSEPEDFKKAVYLLSESKPDIIDINMGCPATKIVKENSGSALMKDPKLCGEIVKATVNESKVPVTVKIRSGWNKNSINAVEVAKICEYNGASAVTVHGRTKEQGYSGLSDLEIIKSVKDSVKIPVIGNGDVIDGNSAKRMKEYTSCDMIAVGRGAMGNPWIFSEINSAFNDEILFIEPTLSERAKIMKLHIEKLCGYKGESVGLKEARKHIACYIKGINGASYFRKLAFDAKTKDELINICDNL
ncbi:MAG: tRNA dihydrouridine synthase DusB [Clostridia bacterium]|nr:tRNA dihydrouridine synthase DusB [Clostridia bacterium]